MKSRDSGFCGPHNLGINRPKGLWIVSLNIDPSIRQLVDVMCRISLGWKNEAASSGEGKDRENSTACRLHGGDQGKGLLQLALGVSGRE